MEKRSHINVGDSLTIPAGTEVGVFTDAACTIAATIYADDGVTPADNPVIVDANGEFSYRAANGVYYEKIETEPAAELRFDDGSGYATSGHVHANYLAKSSDTLTNVKQADQNIASTGATEVLSLANGNIIRTVMDQNCEFELPTLPAAGVSESFVHIIEPTGFAMSWKATPAYKWMTSDKLGPATVAAGLEVTVTAISSTRRATPRWNLYLSAREVA